MSTLLLSIDVTKLKKEWFFESKMGSKFADLIMFENDQPDKFGYTHAIKQNPPKVEREAGAKSHYVGNAKPMPARSGGNSRPAPQATHPTARRPAAKPPVTDSGLEWRDGDEIPF